MRRSKDSGRVRACARGAQLAVCVSELRGAVTDNATHAVPTNFPDEGQLMTLRGSLSSDASSSCGHWDRVLCSATKKATFNASNFRQPKLYVERVNDRRKGNCTLIAYRLSNRISRCSNCEHSVSRKRRHSSTKRSHF